MNHSRRLQFLGCPVDAFTREELLGELTEKIRQKASPSVIQFANANKIAKLREDPMMGQYLDEADYVLADGQPMLPMAAMLGLRIPERIDGIGLMGSLLNLAEREGFSVYLLGAKQEVLEACVEEIRKQHPGLKIAGWRNGYFKEEEIPGILEGVRKEAPDFLFLGMGSPMKERLAHDHRTDFGARVIQGVGGSFDVMAGMVERAPVWMQRIGMEWLFRVAQEPRRMFWRYFKTNTVCLWAFSGALISRWSGLGGAARDRKAASESR